MTSANVTNYRIEKDGREVGKHSQHCYCKTRWFELDVFQPPSDYTITPYSLDEEEEEWEGERESLEVFLNRVNYKPKWNPPKVVIMT